MRSNLISGKPKQESSRKWIKEPVRDKETLVLIEEGIEEIKYENADANIAYHAIAVANDESLVPWGRTPRHKNKKNKAGK